MNRLEFMSELERLLADISKSEREEALNYYNDYLNDAGVENEEEVIESLGSPGKVAATIKAGLFSNEEGAFTENGYLDYEEEKKNTVTVRTREEHRERKTEPEGEGSPWQGTSRTEAGAGADSQDAHRTEQSGTASGKRPPRKRHTGNALLWILLCILFSPFLLTIGAVAACLVFGFVVTVAALVFSLFITVGALAFSLLVVGIVLVGLGIGKLFISPLGGITLFGGGIFCTGIGLLFLALTVWIVGSLIPGMIRLIVNLFSGLFHRKRGVEA